MLAAAVAAAAVGGVILAVVLSGGSGSDSSSGTEATISRAGDDHPAGHDSDHDETDRHVPAARLRPARPRPPPRLRLRRAGRGRRTFVLGTVDDSLAQRSQALRAGAGGRLPRRRLRRRGGLGHLGSAGQRRPPAALVHVLRQRRRRDPPGRHAARGRRLARARPRHAADARPSAPTSPPTPAALVKLLPQVRAVIVGNEPNLSTFWKPQFGAGGSDLAARAYADLLARSYDAIKAVRPSVLVLGGALSPRGGDRPGGSRPTHSPTAFIRDLGAAYRASGRDRPLMDAFAFHPYMEASKDSPSTSAPGEHDDHGRRLPEAGLAARPGLPRHRPAGRRACRSTTPSSASRPPCRPRSAASTPTSTRRPAPTASPSAPRPPTTAARSSSPTASRPSAACSSSTPSTSRASAAGSRASTSPTARRSRACLPSSAPSPTCATAGSSCR